MDAMIVAAIVFVGLLIANQLYRIADIIEKRGGQEDRD